MFSRLTNVKLGKLFEEDPATLSDVEKALSLVNIKIRDTETSFRPMGDVIDEIASKWNTMNEVEQSAVANAIAGVRQRENFLVLMSNYGQVLKAQTLETESAGLATQRYEIYLLGVEAATNRLADSWQTLWQKMLPPEKISGFLNFWSGIFDALTEDSNMGKTIDDIEVLEKRLASLTLTRDYLIQNVGAEGLSKGSRAASWDKIINDIKETESSIAKLKATMAESGDVAIETSSDMDGLSKSYSESAKSARDAAIGLSDLDGIARQYTQSQEDIANTDITPTIEEATKSLEELTLAAEASSESLFSSNSMLESIISDYDEYGQITIDQAYKMIDAGYAAALAIDTETGAITINKGELRELVLLKAQVAVADAEAAYQSAISTYATVVHTAAIHAEIAALLAKRDALKGIESVLTNTPNAITIPTPYLPAASGGGGSAQNKAEQEYNKLLDETIKKIKDKKNAQKDALKAELDAYKKIIDAAKDLLDQKKDERDYTKQVEEQSKTIADIQEELLELQFDNSAEANAKRLELQEQLAEAQAELEDTQYDRSIDVQKEALDKEYEDYKSGIDARINELELYLADTQRITNDAIKQMGKAGRDLVAAMNNAFGSGAAAASNYAQTVSSTISTAWGDASYAMRQYWADQQQLMSYIPPGEELSNFGHTIPPAGGGMLYPPYHDGGIVSGQGEVFAKLMSGEFVATDDMMKNFLNRTLPKISSTSSNNSNITISMPISVTGNLDRTVLPDLEKMVLKTVNSAISKRGIVRNANSFSI